jgi:quinohemoprotein ethanol dehydrogenase
LNRRIAALVGALICTTCKGETPQDWPSWGGTPEETHASPLTGINTSNVSRLGLVQAYDLGNDAGGGTTPIAVDGIVYATVGQSVVRAFDVRTGKQLWMHDPETWKVAGRKLRYAFGVRGLAYSQGKIYIGTMDGRLLALDAKTGNEVWSVRTTLPDDDRYITGAPRVFRGLVIIGHGGADVSALRGYVTAYDARTGKEKWRFFTVPGDPSKGFENEAMEAAAPTWSGEWWKYGGGGTVWNSITFDAEQNLVYLGTGNGGPHDARVRSPGGGDNLYLCSIVALDADSGEYRWHYQVNPGDSWDYNAAMDIELATIRIDGKPRKVILHAPKNGFFYVIDRTNGKLISADRFADHVTWATNIDLKSGRPVETANARYSTPQLLWPGPMGAHNWAPMSYNSGSGLVYIPTIELPGMFDDSKVGAHWQYQQGRWDNTFGTSNDAAPADAGTSYLQAYDPVHQRRVWKVPLAGAWPGGTLTTSGNLVFLGQADGKLTAFDATDGKLLWSFDAGLGISGAPISFAVHGKQYVAVVAGWGGGGAGYFGHMSGFGYQARVKHHHLLVFALDGHAAAPVQTRVAAAESVDDPTLKLDSVKVEQGGTIFTSTCASCHGAGVVAAGYAPDLRTSPVALNPEAFRAVLHDGALLNRGMPSYAELSEAELEQLRHFIRAKARAGH